MSHSSFFAVSCYRFDWYVCVHVGAEYMAISYSFPFCMIWYSLQQIVVKGVMTAEDASEAVRQGVDGIWISNHGARQLDTTPATIEVLPEVNCSIAEFDTFAYLVSSLVTSRGVCFSTLARRLSLLRTPCCDGMSCHGIGWDVMGTSWGCHVVLIVVFSSIVSSVTNQPLPK